MSKTTYAKDLDSCVDLAVAEILNHVEHELWFEGRDTLVEVCRSYVALHNARFETEEKIELGKVPSIQRDRGGYS